MIMIMEGALHCFNGCSIAIKTMNERHKTATNLTEICMRARRFYTECMFINRLLWWKFVYALRFCFHVFFCLHFDV